MNESETLAQLGKRIERVSAGGYVYHVINRWNASGRYLK